MIKKTYCLLLIVWCLLLSTAWAGNITIKVYEHVEVKGPMLTLGDLAEITGDDSARMDALKGIRLGSAPRPGETAVLTKETLGMRLASVGDAFSDVTWLMPQETSVTTEFQYLSGQSLTECALEAVKHQLGTSEDITIETVNQPPDAKLPIGFLTLKAEVPHTIRYNGPTFVKVLAYVDNQLVETEQVKLNAKLYKNVVVAAKAMMSHEVFTAESIRLERMDISRIPGNSLTDAAQVIGLSAKKDLTPGTVLNRAFLEKPVLIKNGDMVTIIARIGGIEISAPGQAMQDGTQDKIIRVKNLSSQKSIAAKVLDSSSVLAITSQGK